MDNRRLRLQMPRPDLTQPPPSPSLPLLEKDEVLLVESSQRARKQTNTVSGLYQVIMVSTFIRLTGFDNIIAPTSSTIETRQACQSPSQ